MNNFVGIDVSKANLDWAIHQGREGRVQNRKVQIRRLVTQLQKLHPTLVVVESTGGYERALIEALQEAHVPVAHVNPWRVRRFGEGLGQLAKTDPIDARILARFADQAVYKDPQEVARLREEFDRLKTDLAAAARSI